LTWGAAGSFVYLLIVGSLVGFVAFNWLLGHVPATLVSTYAYVNPLVALVVGWLLGGEELTVQILIGMVIILAGVALVRSGGSKPKSLASESDHSPYRASKSESTRTATRSLMP
jgi:drug/metabolite transporter (DMT)-like permease